MKISQRFKEAIRLSPFRQYKLAVRAGLHPSSLSLLLNEGRKPQPGDERLIKIGQILGLKPEEVFEMKVD